MFYKRIDIYGTKVFSSPPRISTMMMASQ